MNLADKLASKQKELSSLNVKYEFLALIAIVLVAYMVGGSVVKSIESLFFSFVQAVVQIFSMRISDEAQSILAKILSVACLLVVADLAFTYIKRLKQDKIVKGLLDLLYEQAVEFKKEKNKEGLDSVIANLMALNNVNRATILGAKPGESEFQHSVIESAHRRSYFGGGLTYDRACWYSVAAISIWLTAAVNTPHFITTQFFVSLALLAGWRVLSKTPSVAAVQHAYDKAVTETIEGNPLGQYEYLPLPTLPGLNDVKPYSLELVNKVAPDLSEYKYFSLKVLLTIMFASGLLLLGIHGYNLRQEYPVTLSAQDNDLVKAKVNATVFPENCVASRNTAYCWITSYHVKGDLGTFYSPELMYSIPMIVPYDDGDTPQSPEMCTFKGYVKVSRDPKDDTRADGRTQFCVSPILLQAIEEKLKPS